MSSYYMAAAHERMLREFRKNIGNGAETTMNASSTPGGSGADLQTDATIWDNPFAALLPNDSLYFGAA